MLNSQNRNLIKPEEWIFEWHKELQDSTKEIYTLTPPLAQADACASGGNGLRSLKAVELILFLIAFG